MLIETGDMLMVWRDQLGRALSYLSASWWMNEVGRTSTRLRQHHKMLSLHRATSDVSHTTSLISKEVEGNGTV